MSYGSHRNAIYISLWPAAARAILGLESTELSNRLIDLSDLWGRSVASLRQRLLDAASWSERFEILDAALLQRLRAVSFPREIAWAWSRIQAASGQISVEELAREIGWSRRHFAERFRTAIGVTPKTAGRILRFEYACRLIKHERPGLAHVAAACGFHDQAHMNREWNLMAGCTPREWMRRELPFFQDFDPWSGDNVPQPEELYEI